MHQLLITVSLFALVQGFPWYQRSIPNGNKVPSPCETGSKIWLGVGHVEEPGGGARNSFGRDFFQAGKIWTVNLCEMDSDGDGKTNGEELGDPYCLWYEGQTPRFNASGHPGICEPMYTPKCLAQNVGIYCNHAFGKDGFGK